MADNVKEAFKKHSSGQPWCTLCPKIMHYEADMEKDSKHLLRTGVLHIDG